MASIPRVHHGQAVEKQLYRRAITIKELAEALGINRRTLDRWLKEPSWQTGYLERAGDFLGFNPFAVYCQSAETNSKIN